MIRLADINNVVQGSTIEIPLTHDEPNFLSVSFTLHFDPTKVIYRGIITSIPQSVADLGDRLSVVLGGATQLPPTIASFQFEVLDSDILTLSNVVGSRLEDPADPASNPVDFNPSFLSGSINLEELAVNVTFEVPEFSAGVPYPSDALGAKIFESDNADPDLGTVVEIAQIDAPARVSDPVILAENRGDRWYFAKYFNDAPVPGPRGPVTLWNTDRPPVDAPGALIIREV